MPVRMNREISRLIMSRLFLFPHFEFRAFRLPSSDACAQDIPHESEPRTKRSGVSGRTREHRWLTVAVRADAPANAVC
jgi:hypothetical protein